jgi:hypothetical protein
MTPRAIRSHSSAKIGPVGSGAVMSPARISTSKRRRRSACQARCRLSSAVDKSSCRTAAHDWVFANKAESLDLLKKHVKRLDDKEAYVIYTSLTTGAGGLNKHAEINMAGMKTVLSLRGEYATLKKTLTHPNKYVDLSYQKKASAK